MIRKNIEGRKRGVHELERCRVWCRKVSSRGMLTIRFYCKSWDWLLNFQRANIFGRRGNLGVFTYLDIPYFYICVTASVLVYWTAIFHQKKKVLGPGEIEMKNHISSLLSSHTSTPIYYCLSRIGHQRGN